MRRPGARVALMNRRVTVAGHSTGVIAVGFIMTMITQVGAGRVSTFAQVTDRLFGCSCGRSAHHEKQNCFQNVVSEFKPHGQSSLLDIRQIIKAKNARYISSSRISFRLLLIEFLLRTGSAAFEFFPPILPAFATELECPR